MRKRQTLIDRAIASLEGEVAVLQLALAKLRTEQANAFKRKPSAKAAKTPKTGRVYISEDGSE